jgi:hypothetical protein
MNPNPRATPLSPRAAEAVSVGAMVVSLLLLA